MRFVCPECGETYGGPGMCPRDQSPLADASLDPLLGATLGSWRVTRLAGRGGMGQVYRGVQPAIGSRVAIKVLSEARPALVERFFAEARSVNLIRHEHIVNILAFESLPDGRPYIVMEYLDGATLGAIAARCQPLPLGWLARLVGEVASALAAAHASGVIHRDLKPDNVFVTPAGHAKVLDFGIAKLRIEANVATPETREGALMGTPFYMSPEQALGQPVDPRSDLYSLGIVLYECATGRRPFQSDNLYVLLRMHGEAAPEPPSRIRPDLPPAFEQCILRAMQKDPALRYQSAAEMAAALTASVAHLPPESFTPPAFGAFAPVAQTARPLTPEVGGTLPVAAPVTAMSLGATLQPAKRARAPLWPWFVGLGALAGVGLIVAVVVVVATERPVPRKHGDSPVMTSTVGPDGGVVRPPVDVTAELSRSERLAREKIPDAELVRIAVTGMDPSGHVDLNRIRPDSQPQVEYVYGSPARALSWAKEPAGAKKTVCMVHVTYGLDGIQVYDDVDQCDGVKAPKPRCSAKQIWARAIERGGAGDHGDFEYHKTDDGSGFEWYVTMPGFSGSIADAC